MKVFTSIFVMTLMAMSTFATGTDSSWALYFYSETAGLDGDVGTFKTTDTDGIFILEGVKITAEGIGFCVHNADWSTNYGWSDEGGSVDSTDKAITLATSATASGWLALPVGSYDVTWNTNSLTITFVESNKPGTEKADWQIYFYSEEAGLNGDAGQFSTTETDGIFVLEGCTIKAQGVGFCIHNSAWDACYGWSDEGGTVASAGTDYLLAASTAASGWLNIPVGTYKVTWNTNNLTVRFDRTNTTSVRSLLISKDNSKPAYNLAGQRVGNLYKGIVIINGKKYINR